LIILFIYFTSHSAQLLEKYKYFFFSVFNQYFEFDSNRNKAELFLYVSVKL